MPGGDGTGPQGQGPMTGRGTGTCNPAGENQTGMGQGLGRGLGRGAGRGNGRGRAGTGMQARQRFSQNAPEAKTNQAPVNEMTPAVSQQAVNNEEVEALQAEISKLRNEVDKLTEEKNKEEPVPTD